MITKSLVPKELSPSGFSILLPFYLNREERINQINLQSFVSYYKYNFSGELTLKKIGFSTVLSVG